MRDQGTGGVEHHRVAHRAALATQHGPHRLGIGRGVAAGELGQIRTRETERRGIQGQPLHGAGLHPPDGAGRRGGQLVEPVVAVHHQDTGPARGEHPGHHLGQICPRTADQPGPRRGRIGQRAQQIEDRRHPDLAPYRRRVPIRRVEIRGEGEADPHLRHAPHHVTGRQIDPDPERLQGVRAAGERRRGAVPVLDHRHPTGRHHDRGHGRQVHRVLAVTAGSDDVHAVADTRERLGGHLSGVSQHAVGQLGHLGGRRALHLHRDGEASNLRRGRRTRHDLVHCPARLSGSQVLAGGQAAQDLRPEERFGGHFRTRRHGWHDPIMANVATRVEFDNYKASYLPL